MMYVHLPKISPVELLHNLVTLLRPHMVGAQKNLALGEEYLLHQPIFGISIPISISQKRNK
jgi:hypothetical protein